MTPQHPIEREEWRAVWCLDCGALGIPGSTSWPHACIDGRAGHTRTEDIQVVPAFRLEQEREKTKRAEQGELHWGRVSEDLNKRLQAAEQSLEQAEAERDELAAAFRLLEDAGPVVPQANFDEVEKRAEAAEQSLVGVREELERRAKDERFGAASLGEESRDGMESRGAAQALDEAAEFVRASTQPTLSSSEKTNPNRTSSPLQETGQ